MKTKRVRMLDTVEDSHNYLDERNKVVSDTSKFYINGGEKGDGVYEMEIGRADKLIGLDYAEEVPEEAVE